MSSSTAVSPHHPGTVPGGVPAAAAALQPLLNVGAQGEPCPRLYPSVPESLVFRQSSLSHRFLRAQPHLSHPILSHRRGPGVPTSPPMSWPCQLKDGGPPGGDVTSCHVRSPRW